MLTPSHKHAIKMVALVTLFLVGVGVMLYPFVSNAIYQHRANASLADLTLAVSEGDPHAYDAELERAAEYNKVLVGQTVPDVFAIREGTTDPEYESFLNVRGDQVMGSVEIPVIAVRLPIYHYSTEESLAKGCGHIFGSSLPVGGASTHAVITAHRGLPAAKLFTDLDQLVKGDRFYVKTLDRVLAYEVDQIEVVKPTETRSLAIRRGEDLVTLVTCTPYGVNTDRLLVRGHRVPYVEADEKVPVVRHGTYWLHKLLEVACVAFGVGLAVGVRALVVRHGKGTGSDAGSSVRGAGAHARAQQGAPSTGRTTGSHAAHAAYSRPSAGAGTHTRAARHMAPPRGGAHRNASEKGDYDA